MTRAALFVVFGVWCLLVFFENRAREKQGGWMLYLGVAGSAAFYLHTWCVLGAARQPVPHPAGGGDFFRAGGASFVTALLRALYLPGGVGTAPALSRCGLLAFFFCTCLALPPGRMAGDERRGHAGLVSAGHHAGMHGPLGAACARNIARRG